MDRAYRLEVVGLRESRASLNPKPYTLSKF